VVQTFVIHAERYPAAPWSLQSDVVSSGPDPTRTLRGALCGAIAAAAWALEQPLDKQIFDCSFDDVELLGKLVTREDGWYPIGFAMHMANGALFGGVYANLAPRIGLPAPLRGPAAALVEHVASWPLAAITDRAHPARAELPRLFGSRAALAQATWRHLLFGIVLGELERRANREPEEPEPVPEAYYSSNGHGSLDHALSAHPDS
jgi:hypothetical protein